MMKILVFIFLIIVCSCNNEFKHLKSLEQKVSRERKGYIYFQKNENKKLRYLSIEYLSEKGFPMEIFEFVELETLYIAHTLIEVIPIDWTQMSNLKIASISTSNIKGNVELKLPLSLQYFGLYYCDIDSVTFINETNLLGLSLGKNRIRNLNQSFCNHKYLKEIAIGGNLIEDIDLTCLKNLEAVNCMDCPLKDTLEIKKRHGDKILYFLTDPIPNRD